MRQAVDSPNGKFEEPAPGALVRLAGTTDCACRPPSSRTTQEKASVFMGEEGRDCAGSRRPRQVRLAALQGAARDQEGSGAVPLGAVRAGDPHGRPLRLSCLGLLTFSVGKSHMSRMLLAALGAALVVPCGLGQVQWQPRVDLAPRTGHGMAYDSVRQRVLMFGGGIGRSDLWSWDGTRWSL